MENRYEYRPEELLTVGEASAVAQGITGLHKLMTQHYNKEWVKQKNMNTQHNLSEAHGIYYKGTYHHNP